MNFSHTPVMLRECVEALKIDPNGVYVDATMGGGGHSLEIARRLFGGRLICFDKDPDAVAAAHEKLKGYPVEIIESDFSRAGELLAETEIDGALFDLGVSSHQLDSAERGFSYHEDAPLDMRMSKEGTSARDVVNGYALEELTRVIREYGESPFAYEIAKKIVRARESAPIETTSQLAKVCLSAVAPSVRRKDKHPARTVFQAIRIEVNDELTAIRGGLSGCFSHLKSGGRIAVLTFHSVEDRVVKQLFKELVGGCTCPPEFPVCVCGRTPQAIILTKKPKTASSEELSNNRRARSAKLRVIERI